MFIELSEDEMGKVGPEPPLPLVKPEDPSRAQICAWRQAMINDRRRNLSELANLDRLAREKGYRDALTA